MLREILKNDIKYMKKDPMIAMVFAAPVLFAVFYRVIILRFDLLIPYRSVFQYIFAVMLPFMIGMVLGFRMLDEKDEHMLSFYAVSPLGLRGYILLRVIMGIVLGALTIWAVSLFGVVPKEYWFFISVQVVLLAPLVFLILGVIGKNKIQGLTLVKIVGMLFMLPVLRVIKDNPLDYLFMFIPSYNVFELIVRKSFDYWVLIYTGGLFLSLYLLASHFENKCISDI